MAPISDLGAVAIRLEGHNSPRRSTMISANQKQHFVEHGYLTVRGLLDVRVDIECFREAYVGYLDTLAEIVIGEKNPNLRAAHSAKSFAERFANCSVTAGEERCNTSTRQ
jgi:hypothetical protein